MLKKIENIILSLLSKFVISVAVNTINSACWYSFGQEKEPESLQRFKKARK